MADYSSPYMPNVFSNANAMNTMQGLADRQKQNQANMEASQHIANGDYASAEQAYRAAGMNDQADAARAKGTSITAGNHIANGDYHSAADVMLKNGYYDQAQKFTNDHRDDINKLYGIGAQIAQMPDLQPEQWQQFMQTAKKDGFDVSQFEDPKSGPPLMAAYAGKIQDYNKTLDSRKTTDDALEERAKRVIAGQEPWPNATRGDKDALAVQKKVRELDQTFAANRYPFRQGYEDANKSVQKSLSAFQTALHHAETIHDSTENVSDTGTIPTNALYHGLQRQYGATALKNFEDTAAAFGKEVDKAFVGGVGTGQERHEAEARVSSSLPRDTVRSGNAANVELMIGKMLSLENQWRKNMGPNVPPPPSLTDDEKAIAQKIFDAEPNETLKAQRRERLGKDPRTADLVGGPSSASSAANSDVEAHATIDGKDYVKRKGQWIPQ